MKWTISAGAIARLVSLPGWLPGIARGASLALMGRLANAVCHFAAMVLIARGLGQAQFGVYAFALELSFLLCMVSDGGMSIVLIREIARDKDRAPEFLANAMLLRVFLSGAAMLLILMVGRVLTLNPTEARALSALGAANLLFMWGNLAIAVFRAYERMELEGMVVAVQGLTLLTFVLLVTVVWRGALDLDTVVIGPVWASAVMVIIGLGVSIRWLVKPRFVMEPAMLKQLIREGLPILTAFLLMRGYRSASVVALQRTSSAAEVGTFNAAYRLVDSLGLVPIVAGAALLPALSRVATTSRAELLSMSTGALRAVFSLALPVALGTTVLSGRVVLLFFGEVYAGAALPLRVMIWGIACFFLSYVLKTVLEATGRQMLWTRALVVGLLAALTANAVLVGRYGVLGASMAALIAEVTVLLLAFYCVSRRLPVARELHFVPRTLLSGLIMVAGIYPMRSHSLFIAVPVGALLYGGSLLLGEMALRDRRRPRQVSAATEEREARGPENDR